MTEIISSHDSRASPAFDPPKYKISYGPDQVLQWDPPSNSRALAVALSWHFPVEKTLENKMQAAIKVFLKEEQKSSLGTDSGSSPEATSNPVSRESESLQPTLNVSDGLNKRPLTWSESAFQVLNWDPDVKGFKPKRQRRKYEKDEGVKVKANRGNACEEHRRRKVKCDPDSCPYNKQRGKPESVLSRDSEKTGGNLPNSSVGSDTTPPLEDEKYNEAEINMQSAFGPSVASRTVDSIHTFQDDEFSWQPEPKIESNSHFWTGSHPLTPPFTDFNVSPTRYLQNMHHNENQEPNFAPLAFNAQQDNLLQGFDQSGRQDLDDWWLSDYLQFNKNNFQSVHSEGNNDQNFHNQLITPTDLPGPNEAHLRDSFLLESENFDFQPQLQQSLSSLEDSTGLQGFQGPNRLELPSRNYTSLGPFVNEDPHSFKASSGQISGLSAPLLCVSNNMEAEAESNGYTQAEDIVTSLPAAFDPRRTDIMESRKNRDVLSTHTQHNIGESQASLEGVSSNELLRMYSTMRKPLNPAKMNLANGERSPDLESYSPVPRRNINAKSTAPITGVGENWLSDSTFNEGKALDLPEIQGAAAEYYAVPPINFSEQTIAPSITTCSSSARKGNSGKIRKVARALAAFGNRLSTAPPDQFDDSSSRSLELAVDYPPIREEELRDHAVPQIREQNNSDFHWNFTPVLRKHRPSPRSSFTSSAVSRRDVPAVYTEDLWRRDTFEVPSPVHHRSQSTRSRPAPPESLQLQHPPSPADEIRRLGPTVEETPVLANMDEPIAREAASALEMNASPIEDKESSFPQRLRRGSSSKLGGDNDDLEITAAPLSDYYEDLFPGNLDRGGTFEDPPSSLPQSIKATTPAPPPMVPAWSLPPLKEAGPSMPLPPNTRAGPSKSDPTPSIPISVSNQAVPSDDLEIHELFTPQYHFQYAKIASMASSETEEEEEEEEEESKAHEEIRGPRKLVGDKQSPLEEAIRSVEEGNYVLPDPQRQPQSPHQKDDSFDSTRHYATHLVPASGPAWENNYKKETKMAKKKAKNCGPGGPCIWVLCLPCAAIEVVKWGGKVVGKYGREGVKITKEGVKKAKGWIRGFGKGK